MPQAVHLTAIDQGEHFDVGRGLRLREMEQPEDLACGVRGGRAQVRQISKAGERLAVLE